MMGMGISLLLGSVVSFEGMWKLHQREEFVCMLCV